MISIEDRLAITDLYATYNHAIDTADTNTWVETFTADAIFSARQRLVGHDALRTFSEERRKTMHDEHSHREIQHWNNNLRLVASEDYIQGSCYFLLAAIEQATNAFEVMAMGRYLDKLVKIDGRWRFAERVVQFAQ